MKLKRLKEATFTFKELIAQPLFSYKLKKGKVFTIDYDSDKPYEYEVCISGYHFYINLN